MLIAKTVNEERMFHGIAPLPVDDPRGEKPAPIGENALLMRSKEEQELYDSVMKEITISPTPVVDGGKISWSKLSPPLATFDPLGDTLSVIKTLSIHGSDKDVVNAARASFNQDDIEAPFDWKKDVNLIRYLLNHEHGSPLEHNLLKFYVTAPNFIVKQMLRHRVGVSFNELSGRYTVVDDNKFYVPTVVRIQHKNNRQASTDVTEEAVQSYGFNTVEEWTLSCQDDFRDAWQYSYGKYQSLLTKGVAKEQARGVLPIGQYSSLYITFNLRSLLHFAGLRTHEGAQYEIQQYAKIFLDEASRNFPVSVAVFKDMHPDVFGHNHHLEDLLAS